MSTIDTVPAARVAAAHPQLIHLSRDLYEHSEIAWEEVRSSWLIAAEDVGQVRPVLTMVGGDAVYRAG